MTAHQEQRTIVYVANAESGDISVLELHGNDGTLSEIEIVPAGGRAMPLAISPDRAFLFAALRSEPYGVVSFAIAPESGRLLPASSAPLPDNMAYLSTDRSGHYLFGASYSGSRMSVNAIRPDGEVDPTPLAVLPTGKNAHAIATDPANRFLFVTNLGDDQIQQYLFDEANGEVRPNDPPAVATAPGAGPRHFVFHPSQPWVYCLNELDGTVNSYELGEAGTLSPLATVSALPDDFTGKPWAADIHLTPDGRFLYASERTSSTLAAFRVEADRTLTVIGHAAAEHQPRGFNIDPQGRFLIVAGERSHAVGVFAIGDDQERSALRQVSRLGVGQAPNWIEIITLPGK